jgi:hypothetical protein
MDKRSSRNERLTSRRRCAATLSADSVAMAITADAASSVIEQMQFVAKNWISHDGEKSKIAVYYAIISIRL